MFAFRAMNTEVHVIADLDEEATAARVFATFAAAEDRFSRFRYDSELSALNRADGPFVASEQLFDMLLRARFYMEMTNGLFDPAVGSTLIALGYDRSFAPGALDCDHVERPPLTGQFLDVVLERETRTVWRPRHVHLDLGGIAKGKTVDVAAKHLTGPGAIDAGGDAVLRGKNPAGGQWLVDIEDPRDPSRIVATVAVSDAAVATSSCNRRRWRVGDGFAHHLIDPRTRSSAVSDLAQTTVLTTSAELADVLAKTAFLLGARPGRRFLERLSGVGAVFVHTSGAVTFVGSVDVRGAP